MPVAAPLVVAALIIPFSAHFAALVIGRAGLAGVTLPPARLVHADSTASSVFSISVFVENGQSFAKWKTEAHSSYRGVEAWAFPVKWTAYIEGLIRDHCLLPEFAAWRRYSVSYRAQVSSANSRLLRTMRIMYASSSGTASGYLCDITPMYTAKHWTHVSTSVICRRRRTTPRGLVEPSSALNIPFSGRRSPQLHIFPPPDLLCHLPRNGCQAFPNAHSHVLVLNSLPLRALGCGSQHQTGCFGFQRFLTIVFYCGRNPGVLQIAS
eukprot:Em0009g704a